MSSRVDYNFRPQVITEMKQMQEGDFDFEDLIHKDETLARMNTMRKEGQFCDAILEIDGKSIYGHRIVLASSNVFFFEFFSTHEEKSGRKGASTIFKLDEFHLDYFAVQLLVNYFYSGRISCTFAQVWPLYNAAIKLKVTRVAEQCSQYLIKCLTPQNCLGTYKFALTLDDKDCMKKVAEYIQDHVTEIIERSSELSHLPSLVVDIIGSESLDFYLTEQPLCKLVVSWLHEEGQLRSLHQLVEHAHNLILTPDNKLIDYHHDASSNHLMQDSRESKRHNIQDVSKMLEKRAKTNVSPGNKSPLPHFSDDDDECRCGLVASTVVADKSFICLAAYDKTLVHISIKFRSGDTTWQSDVGGNSAPDMDLVFAADRKHLQCLMTQLNPMSTPRCGFGVAVIENSIVVVGGYGRGECMSCAESYSLSTNSWKTLKSMHKIRGRFSAGVIGGELVACGGSDGASELNSVEAYDPVMDRWKALPDMLYRKSSAGVAVCNGKLYVIGGLTGSKTLSCCEMFDPQLNQWQKISSLNTGRSQAAVSSYLEGTSVVALGGCNAWNCMNSCEVYDPVNDLWNDLPPLAIARRGAGAAYFKGMLYVIGGSDAQASLTSVEIYDTQNGCWFFGPNLGVPRANMGVTVLGCRIFAIGGYSGKSFLKSLEYLALDSEEWCSFLPADVDVETILRAGSPQGRRRMKNGHRSSASSGGGSVSSNAPSEYAPQFAVHGEHVGLINGSCGAKDVHSDSELSSACSADEIHKEHVINNPDNIQQ